MKKTLFLLLALVILTTSVFSGVAVANAENGEEVTIRVATEVADVDTRYEARANRAFVERLDADPTIAVTYYPGAALGDQTACYEMLRRGLVEINVIQASNIAGVDYPNFGLFDLPYLFLDADEAKEVLDPNGPLTTALREDYAEKTGVRLLCFTVNGFRNLTNSKREVKTVDDLKGLKLRTLSAPIQIAAWESAGAQVTPMAFTELYSALQTGVVDGQENPVAVIMSNNFNEVQKYLTLTNHLLSVGSMVMSNDVYQSLTPEQQKLIDDAAVEYFNLFCDSCRDEDATLLDKVIDENLMQVYRPTEEEIASFREIMQPAARSLVEESMDDTSFLDLLLSEVDRVRAS